jgi:hydroxyacylglutathione hydrolase
VKVQKNAMPLELVTIPCRSDNYAFLLHDAVSGETALIDAPEAAPIEAELAARGWGLTQILITHHHDDHIAGVETLRAHFGAGVMGALADAPRLPPLDRNLREGDSIRLGREEAQVIDVSGHTVGHLAFYLPTSKMVFTADSLMAMGCGRLFEGSAAQMWASLCKLAALPPETLVCSGHEYTSANAAFAATIDPENPALARRIKDIADLRAAGLPTVPSTLELELATNPFLRAADPSVRALLGLDDAPDVEVFTEIRKRKDSF